MAASNKIKVFDENNTSLLDTTLFNESALRRTTGFVANTPITISPMNTLLRGVTLFCGTFLDILAETLQANSLLSDKTFEYSTSLADAKTFINTALKYFVPNVAKKVSNRLTIKLNGTNNYFDGSAAKTITFYAPTTNGFAGSFLVSNGPNAAPTWEDVLTIEQGGTGASSNDFTLNGALVYYDANLEQFKQLGSDFGVGALYRTSQTNPPSYGVLPLAYGGTGGVMSDEGALYKVWNGTARYGTLPVKYGGTGATTKGQAREHLGIVCGTRSFTIAVGEQIQKKVFTISYPVGMTSVSQVLATARKSFPYFSVYADIDSENRTITIEAISFDYEYAVGTYTFDYMIIGA